eukprot:1145918-Pelagomonas_calceolata.AAC.4
MPQPHLKLPICRIITSSFAGTSICNASAGSSSLRQPVFLRVSMVFWCLARMCYFAVARGNQCVKPDVQGSKFGYHGMCQSDWLQGMLWENRGLALIMTRRIDNLIKRKPRAVPGEAPCSAILARDSRYSA